ncbi:MAG: HNH endonuclease family protein, partial [Bacteroidales bacterium]|nr:HNH endonuclease family protein [Bacteroidales bacterium]
DFKNFGTSDIDGVGNIKSAVDIIREELLKKNVDLFAQYFYHNVKLFRVMVPLGTDLNHYFEIMNSRGEQLEKHEIVKALLIGQIQGTTEVQNKFAAVWDACSDMNDYIYSHFKSLSDSQIDKITFDDILLFSDNDEDEDISLSDILANHVIPSDFPGKEIRIKEKYRSIIDFPNFLLQVLKIRHNEVPLDDKSLVKHFTPYLNEPIEFITDLLKYRWLFDKYIIKQDLTDTNDKTQSWGIRKLSVNDNSNGTVKTFDDDEELVKLQVILYYSDSTNTYNNWLFEFLKFVNSNQENYTNYTSKIFEIAGNKFDSSTLSYPDISIFNLYFIDFLFWKLYITEVQNKEYINLQEPLLSLKQKIFNKKNLFNTFRFKHVSSKEHLFPQSKANDFGIEPEYLNSVGNLCLISSSQNSQGNKDMPVAKKKLFETDNSSLKRLIMFESFENDKWEAEQIQKHKEEIISLLQQEELIALSE